MAKRESQGLQIALIIFVVVSVLFMVTTVVFWKKADTATAEKESAQQDRTSALNERTKFETEIHDIKEKILGVTPATSYQEIETRFNQIIMAYAHGLQDDQRNLLDLPQELIDALTKKNASLRQCQSDTLALQKKVKEMTDLAATQKQQAEQAMQKLSDERIAEGREYTKSVQAVVDDRQKDRDSYQAAIAKEQNTVKQRDTAIAEQDDKIKILEVRNERLAESIEGYRQETLTVPDGKVIYVRQSEDLVMINLGRDDAVRELMTFDVYDVGERDLASPNIKGKIEVIRVIDQYTSEARIKSSELANPIMAGDVIHSHIWQRGQHLRFALAGVMDVDDDGQDDRDIIKQLIEVNGGVVDAEIDDQGNQTGPLSIHTRYLVLGTEPTTANEAVHSAYMAMWKEADTLGVEKISYKRILDFVGYDGKERPIPLGKSARAVDFKAQPREGVVRTSRGSVSGLYGQKKPPYRKMGQGRSEPDESSLE